MKMPKSVYEKIKAAISTLDADKVQRHINFLRIEGIAKSIPKRLRWDAYWEVVPKDLRAEICALDLHGDHIDTALRKAWAELNLPTGE